MSNEFKNNKISFSTIQQGKNLFTRFIVKLSVQYFLLSIIIILLGFIFFSIIPNVTPDYTSTILAFIGIIATFIVISNYMQVRDIKEEFREKVEKLEKTEQHLFNLIKELEKQLKEKTDPSTVFKNNENIQREFLRAKGITNY